MIDITSVAPIPFVVQQHAEETAMLRLARSFLVRSSEIGLDAMARHDRRIAAHLDGLQVAGSCGLQLCMQALERTGAGEVFAASACAIQLGDERTLADLIEQLGAEPEAMRGLSSALGWSSARQLQGLVIALLSSADPHRRQLGFSACRHHGVGTRAALLTGMDDSAPAVRNAALRAAGEFGLVECLPAIRDALARDDGLATGEIAGAAIMLGDRDEAVLAAAARVDDPHARIAASGCLPYLAAPLGLARSLIRALAGGGAEDAALRRRVIRACGWSGDAASIPWLIELMGDDRVSRVAGESFALITGVDLQARRLHRASAPEGAKDAVADSVAIDEDEGLPWPDRDAVHLWSKEEAHRWPASRPWFMGAPPEPEHCLRVLTGGRQRQRIIAARHLKLARAGEPLFNVCAPAWRQQRGLQTMAG